MRSWEPYIDNRGLLVHLDGGGDTANREGLFAIAEVLCPNPPARAISWDLRRGQLEIEPGIYVRHPEHSRAVPSFWSNPNEFSRDQQLPLTVALILKNDQWGISRLFRAHSRRFFKCQNKDWLGPAIYLRNVQNRLLRFPAWVLLHVCDLSLVVNSILRCIYGRNPDDVGNDLNHVATLLLSRVRLPTITSWFARKLYVLFRPGGAQRAWDWYFREESGGPPMNELWAPLIAKYING